MDVNYKQTLIAVAEDCPVQSGSVPEPRGGKPTLALIQYELLRSKPYGYTSAEVIFQANHLSKGLSPADIKSSRDRLWAAFFGKPQACLRASPLPKRFGWGIHCNEDGKVALVAMESAEYKRLLSGKGGVKVLKALRSSKG